MISCLVHNFPFIWCTACDRWQIAILDMHRSSVNRILSLHRVYTLHWLRQPLNWDDETFQTVVGNFGWLILKKKKTHISFLCHEMLHLVFHHAHGVGLNFHVYDLLWSPNLITTSSCSSSTPPNPYAPGITCACIMQCLFVIACSM